MVGMDCAITVTHHITILGYDIRVVLRHIRHTRPLSLRC